MEINSLIDIIDSQCSTSDIKAFDSLLNAMNDWPKEISTTSEYFNQVMELLNLDKLDVKSIKKRKKKLKAEGNLWVLESLSELIIFLENSSDEAKEILNRSANNKVLDTLV